MKIFKCAVCTNVLFFENVACARCGHPTAFLPDHHVLSALEPRADGTFRALTEPAAQQVYKLCANGRELGVCNWAVPEAHEAPLCRSCGLNQVIPNLNDPEGKRAWEQLEIAKRRLIYTLDALHLPLEPKSEQPDRGLAFAFMADDPVTGLKVMTGHSAGLITINIAEADDPYREQTRKEMGEAYRTLLGHFRHESGHYYWDRLIRDSEHLSAFREVFGDERADYDQARESHYQRASEPAWPQSFVSAYASMHPWEDWAETWAHYLHIVDTLETARAYGLVLEPRPVGGSPQQRLSARAVHLERFDDLISAWIPVTIALNSLNRSMGLPDLYPFVLSPRAVHKLRFVHDVIVSTSESALAEL